jgi:toxin ParE1/3/4
MTAKAVVPRRQASRDIEDAIDHYTREAGEQVALKFIDTLEDAYGAMAAHPSSGSPRYAHELGLPGLRSRLLKRYPYVVFYVERDEHIDVWRVLHGRRDIAASLGDLGGD